MLFMATFTTSTTASLSVAAFAAKGVSRLLAAAINAVGNLMCGMFSGLLN